ncbi:hypothetical protein NE865_11761 [Phthorimaea operculella]|nr:hypothetical protein NE865_11761 [Phthorimaea operculella]
MDVYGYPSYQYNQADELTKQILAQQALATSVPYNRSMSEPHNMPAPSGGPWNVQGMPWGMPSPPPVVQFSAPVEPRLPPVVHSKRKSLDIEPVIPAKQLITEEKMAAHLSGLHISSDYTPHSLAADEMMELAPEPMEPSPPSIIDKLKGHKLVLSEEVKKLKDEPLLPAALIERWANYIRSRPQLEKPRMSLVVWKPKEDILEKILEEKDKKKEKENEEPVKRNGVLVTELPSMDVEM